MELCLSLGDGSRTVGFSKESKTADQDKKPYNMSCLDFCMALGLDSPPSDGDQEHEKSQEINGGDDDDEQVSKGDDGSGDNQGRTSLQMMNLLPLVLVNPHRRINSHLQSLPWSSDNGSSENGSSGNMAVAAEERGLDANRMPPPAVAADEASTENSVGSPLIHMEFGMCRAINLPMLSGNKRSSDFEATATENDDVEGERTSSRASDEDENGGINTRKKLRLSKQQSAFLEESFKEHNTLNPKQKIALAKQLNLRPRQVEVWFQNRRARTKLKQTEVDCEYLKRCCETLTEDNRRLHKELQDLRALKTFNPFYMQPPATTLTMCPSCERVAATSATVIVATNVKTATADAIKSMPFPLTRPRFYPFTQTPAHHNINRHTAS